MKKLYAIFFLSMVFSVANTHAQNVFNINDPDSILSTTNPPPAPPWGQLAKWGHAHRLNWPGTGTTTFKSYYFSGMQFRLKFPHSYQQGVADGKKYPIYIFYEGEGEAGTIYDNEYQMFHGGQIFRDLVDAGKFDGFLLYPQSSNGFSQSEFSQVSAVLDSLVKYAKLDLDRVTIDGLSSGGQSSWDFLNYAPQKIAYAAIISAARNEYIPAMPNYVTVPIREWNGGLDFNPDTATARYVINQFKALGGNIVQTVYLQDGHDTWDDAWADPNFVVYMNAAHKANPLLYFQQANFCPGQPINAKMGLQPGFFAYQWALNGTPIPGANTASITVNQLGSYTARFQRTSTSDWSAWSPTPVVITSGAVTPTPAIAVNGLHSIVLPAVDGSTTVPLFEPTGYNSYKWVRLPDSAVVGATNIFNAPVGTYIAQVTIPNACSSTYSASFKVISANATGGPDAATNLTATPLSTTSIQLNWSKNPHPTVPETGFEIYRGLKSGGPYTLVGINDSLTFTDKALTPATTYFYVVRAVNNSAAAGNTNETSALTSADVTPPTAPSTLAVTGSSHNSISLQWGASTDNVGVVYYDIYLGGQKAYTIASTGATTVQYTVENLTSAQIYNLQVKARDAAGNVSPFSNQVTAAAVTSGLTYAYYTTVNSWSTLPNFNTLTPVATGGTNNVSLNIVPPTQTTNYGLIWQGYLNIKKAGTYTLETSSDDGSALWLGTAGSTTSPYNPGGTPLVNNDGLHGTQSATANKTLAVGVYPIAITFFQAGGGAAMQVYWTCTSQGISRSLIPDSAFAESSGLGAAPAAPSALVATSLAYNKISLSWHDNSTNETGFEVYRATASAGPFNTIATTAQGVTSYVDSTVAPSTKYWYEIKAIGQFGQSAFSASANATSQPLPAAPKAPTGLKATTISASTINITWKDTTNDAVSFQVFRSAGDKTGFRVITTIPNNGGTTFNYSDATLFDNVLYYYQIYAVNPGGTSVASQYDSATTLLNQPVITPVPDFTMKYATKDTLALSVTDKDNVALTITAPVLPAFGSITDNGNGTGQIIFSPAASDSGAYTIVVAAAAANGGSAADTFHLVVNNNHLPVFNPLSAASFSEGTTDTINLSATDVDGNAGLLFSSSNLPAFATFVNNSNGTASLVLKPTYISHGTYNVNITVTDVQGGATTRVLPLTIIQKNPNLQVLVRAQYQYVVAKPWNNMTGPKISNLVAADGTVTNIGASFSTPSWWNTYNTGPVTGNNSGVYPDSITHEYYYFGIFGGPPTVDDTISGLTPGAKYNLKFYGGSVFTANCGTTVFTIGSQTIALPVTSNVTNTANFTGIPADANGRIITTMSMGTTDGTPAGFLNAFEIDYQFDDSTAPAKPTNLAASLVQQGVQLTWSTPAYNAKQYQVYRATDTTQPFTLLDPTNTNPTLSSFLDSTVIGHVTYYYKLKAVNQYGDNGFTNTISITTISRIPTVSAINNTTVKAGTTATINFTATDDPGDVVTVTDSLPSFAALNNLGNGSYSITLSPTSANLGTYSASVTATDMNGAVKTVPFNIFVVESNVSSVYIHFGTDTAVAPAPWNNFLGYPFGNKSLSNLQRTDGTNSGYTVSLVEQWSDPPGEYGMNTGDNTGIFPDVVSRSAYNLTDNNTRHIKLTGLDTSKTYSVALFSSLNSGHNGTATYTIGAQSQNFNASYNTNSTVQFNGVKANADGSLTVGFAKNSPRGYFSAMVIQAYDPVVVPVVSPNFVYAEPIFNAKTSLKVSWADRSNNETGFEVWRSTSLNGTYTKVTTTAANVTTYTDGGLAINTQYFYQVRAITATQQSDFSNTASAITPYSVVLEHTTWHFPEGIKPWNNTAVNPQVGDRYPNLIDDQLHNTGMALNILSTFLGEYNGGITSGGHNSFVFPDSVMASVFYVQFGMPAAVLMLDGLDQTKVYRIGFSGSANLSQDVTGSMTINGVTKYLNVDSNTSKVVYFDKVQPNANGQVTMTFNSVGYYGLLNALVIMSYTNSTVGGVPVNSPHSNADGKETGVATATSLVTLDSTSNLKGFRAYPNPFRDGFSVSFENEGMGKHVEIDVYSISGSLIYRQDAGYTAPGMSNYNINLPQSIPVGSYVTVVKLEGKAVKTFNMVKIK